jgi:hypothetical protein
MAREKNVAVVTPKGVAVFPHLHAPDTKFDADGVYKCGIKLDANDAQVVIDAIAKVMPRAQELMEEAKAKEKAKNKLKEYGINAEPWAEDEEGMITFNTKMNARVTSKKDNKTYDLKPALFDAKGTPITFGTKIGGGSIVRLRIELIPYFMASTKQAGVSLRLIGVQVIELRVFQANAAGMGFDTEEDGFDFTEGGAEMFTAPAAEKASTTGDEDDDAGDEDDF